MLYAELFTGCGGMSLGLERAGFEPLFFCEKDAACRKVLSEHWPDIPIVEDVKDVGLATVADAERQRRQGSAAADGPVELDAVADPPRLDLLAGGFPCPDFSYAGQRAGLSGERGALWFEFARVIRLLRPRRVLIENVPGIFTAMGRSAGESAFGTVLADLAEAGYDAQWLCLRASDVGAPHRRERVFIVAADTTGDASAGRGDGGDMARTKGSAEGAGDQRERRGSSAADRGAAPADTGGERHDGRRDTGSSIVEPREGGPATSGHQPSSADAARRRGSLEPEGAGGGATVVGTVAVSGSRAGVGGPAARVRELGRGEGPLAVASDSDDTGRGEQRGPVTAREELGRSERGGGEAAPDADGAGRGVGGVEEPAGIGGALGGVADGCGEDGRLDDAEAASDSGGGRRGRREDPQARDDLTDGREGGRDEGAGVAPGRADNEIEWGAYEPAIRSWERLTRTAPRPTDDRGRLSAPFVEWMMALPDGWTDVEGVSRTARLRMLGNAVVVDVAELLGTAIRREL